MSAARRKYFRTQIHVRNIGQIIGIDVESSHTVTGQSSENVEIVTVAKLAFPAALEIGQPAAEKRF